MRPTRSRSPSAISSRRRSPARWRGPWRGRDREPRGHARREVARAAHDRRGRRWLRGPRVAADLRRPPPAGRARAAARSHRGARGRDRAVRLRGADRARALPPAPPGKGPRAPHRARGALGHAGARGDDRRGGRGAPADDPGYRAQACRADRGRVSRGSGGARPPRGRRVAPGAAARGRGASRRGGLGARQPGLPPRGGRARGARERASRRATRGGHPRGPPGLGRVSTMRPAGPLSPDPLDVESPLRPRTLEEYVGQESVRANLRVQVAAARARGDVLDHVLLCGPPGLGKTSLAHVIAGELGVGLRQTSGPALERPGALAAILTNLERGQVFLIDEIHRLNAVVEETLYPAMEDFQLDLVVGQGPTARSIKLPLKPFCLVGATTRAGLLTSPLRDRFGATFRLDFYSVPELERILARSAAILGVVLEADGAAEIARRARGTPRIANRLLRRVRDFAEVRGDGRVTGACACAALALLEVDEAGFDKMDRALLLTIIDKFGGGPVGLETLAAAVGEERDTIEDVYEPYL